MYELSYLTASFKGSLNCLNLRTILLEMSVNLLSSESLKGGTILHGETLKRRKGAIFLWHNWDPTERPTRLFSFPTSRIPSINLGGSRFVASLLLIYCISSIAERENSTHAFLDAPLKNRVKRGRQGKSSVLCLALIFSSVIMKLTCPELAGIYVVFPGIMDFSHLRIYEIQNNINNSWPT